MKKLCDPSFTKIKSSDNAVKKITIKVLLK